MIDKKLFIFGESYAMSPLEGGIKFIPWNPMDIPLGGGSIKFKSFIIELTKPLCPDPSIQFGRSRITQDDLGTSPLEKTEESDVLLSKATHKRETDLDSLMTRIFPPVPAKRHEEITTTCKKRPAFARLRLGRQNDDLVKVYL
ncbi:MAG: hypothetical protein K9M95_05065 [Candidatus Cloacimonetes bacterium]|nr:hypothetical protein [Candidatus Cloacimonadota bacterium]MCF7883483.1 hypothetical protein [Candidatus Cloacimonadota bacterium]